ncbi:hypothetical protein COURTHOUSE_114 [Mycobacterium phage Courthouse]|uniref:Uncharacterized protein n=2 Tax=Omegavirus courthouse TaxID=1089119 RepID=G8I5H1_9CAUD|nr:tail fiber protein [Mycobacterium phage Courthouse]YP_009205249.1 tail fiber protein [Mycobacterium phage Ariel]ASZ74193.1 hypothetical protein SEA_SQUINT_117 [Mycobacterium phage Squint]ATS92957.1 hypothetical protein SEA_SUPERPHIKIMAN_116 [Mycobacterium phage Superphikiman]AER47965.1 hypothetical protein COURTHOUSE_114 [Mycobacterium phage Courthouse]AIM49996.1 hypothetical protein PBI_ARIEL_119 [Mycobacterium phage Ariel]
MTAPATISVTEMEEMFSWEIPCGGNRFPFARECPEQAAATLVNSHSIECEGDQPVFYKCDFCYSIWLRGHRDKKVTAITCLCGLVIPLEDLYVRI